MALVSVISIFVLFHGRDKNVGERKREVGVGRRVTSTTTELRLNLLTLDQEPISGLL